MYRYGHSVLFPPASLGIVWTITLFAIWLCGDLYFPLTARADEIVLAGVLAFSLGGICAVVVPLRSGRTLAAVSAKRRTQVDRWLTIAGLLSLLNIPFSYLYFKQLSETIAPRESLWRQIRIASNKANISGHTALSIESFGSDALAQARRCPHPVAGNHRSYIPARLFCGTDCHGQVWRGCGSIVG